jgi:hypothetical protein
VFDDSTGDGSISIIHRTGASLQITGEGAITFQTVDGNTISYGSGALTMVSSDGGTVSIKDTVTISDSSGSQLIQVTGSGITLTSANPVTVQAPSVSINASNIALGNSTTELLKLIYQLFTALGSVQVITPVGLAGPLTASPQWVPLVALLTELQQLTGSV